MKMQWVYEDSEEKKAVVERLSQETGLSLEQSRILVNRGFSRKEDVDNLLGGSLQDQHHYSKLKDIDKAIDVLVKAIKNGWHIVQYSDYDVDGITSIVVGYSLLKNLTEHVSYYTNNRFTDGYGLCKAGIDRILKQHPQAKVILTSDNGISAADAVDYANEKGLIVVITDHHIPPERLPSAAAVVDPKRADATYPFDGICGCAVVYKLMQGLYERLGRDVQAVHDYIDVVGVATVADVVPLVDENRYFVREAVRRINRRERYAFASILRAFGATGDIVADYNIGFQIGPMLNAAGRMLGAPGEAIEAFLEKDPRRVDDMVARLKEVNEKRKELTRELYDKAEIALSKKGLRAAIVVWGDYHEGVVGLIAGRLAEKFCRPAIVLSVSEDGSYHGSARSIPGFHLHENLTLLKDMLVGYGGHAMAAGLTVKEENLESFEEAFVRIAQDKLTEEDYIKKIPVDANIFAEKVSPNIIKEIEMMEPYGEGFPRPILQLFSTVNNAHAMGKEKNHLKIKGDRALSIIAWQNFERFKKIGEPRKIRALGSFSLNEFNNKVSFQFVVKDKCLAPYI